MNKLKSWSKVRPEIRERDDETCQFCGLTNEQHKQDYKRGLHVHHIVPRRYGGTNHPSNLITVCETCHKTVEKISRRAALAGLHQNFGSLSNIDGSYEKPARKKVTYTFECPDELWQEWTNSFPREQSINDRLIELIAEDIDG